MFSLTEEEEIRMKFMKFKKFWKKFTCDIMRWHLAPKSQGFDGCSFNGSCPRCGEKVLQDSQGNWF